MDSKNVTGGGGGVKVTYIETQFVTSDAARFKDLVQRLTGRSSALPPAPAPAPHRPRPCRPVDGRPRPCRPDDGRPRGTTAAVPQRYHHYTAAAAVRRPPVTMSRAPTTYLEEDGMGLHDFVDMDDFSDLFYVGASNRSDGCYGG